MNKLMAFLIALVVVALACGLVMTAITNSATAGLGELANIEMAQAMQAQAHATQLATVAGLAGQVIVFFAVLAGVTIGGLLMFLGARIVTRSVNPPALRSLLEDRTPVVQVFDTEPEEILFASWR